MRSDRENEHRGILRRMLSAGKEEAPDLVAEAKKEIAAHHLRVDRFKRLRAIFETFQAKINESNSRQALRSGTVRKVEDVSFPRVFRDETPGPDGNKTSLERGETHKVFTPILATVLSHKDMHPLFDEVLNSESRVLSEEMEKRIESGENYFPFIMIGWGVHGSILSSELLHDYPHLAKRSLGIDHFASYGGQFRNQYGSGAFKMNTENVATGTKRDDNFLSPHAVLQLNEATSPFYGNNLDIGRVVAINGYMSGINPLFNFDLVRVQENPQWAGRAHAAKRPSRTFTVPRGRYILELKSRKSDKLVTVYTDVLALPTGIGQAVFRFDKDEETQRVIEERKRNDGKLPGVVSAQEFNAYVNDPTNPLSRGELVGKKIAVLGAGTSAVTAIESIYRLNNSDMNAYPVKLGSPQEVSWWSGSKKMDHQEIIDALWGRYLPITDVVAKEGETAPNGKIVSHKGYIQRLRKVTTSEGEKIEMISDTGETEIVDIVVAATGYTKDLEQILAPLLGENTLDQVAESIPDPHNPAVIAGKKLKKQDIFFTGPSSLTSAGDQTAYKIKEAIKSFSGGTAYLAGLIAEAVPPESKAEQEPNGLEKYFFFSEKEGDLRRPFHESLSLEESLKAALSSLCNQTQFDAESDTTLTITIQELNRPPNYRAYQEYPDDHLRTYCARVRAFRELDNEACEVNNPDFRQIRAMLNQPAIQQYIYAFLRSEHNNPDMTITLLVKQQAVRLADINIKTS